MGQRFEGRNLDEALESAGSALGVERYRLSYHVVLEKRGFLGGIKRLVIEAEVAEGEPVRPVPPPAASPLAPPKPRERSSSRAPREGRQRERGGRGGGRRERNSERTMRDERPRRALPPEPVPDQGQESAEASDVRQWIDRVAELAGLALEARSEETEDQISIRLYGRDSEALLAHDGELLDSLQILANKGLVGKSVSKLVELDARSFKQQRTSSLERQAREAADRVRNAGTEEILPAMTPIERRLVHLALKDDPEVATESRGDGFYKRVAIIPRAAAGSAEP